MVNSSGFRCFVVVLTLILVVLSANGECPPKRFGEAGVSDWSGLEAFADHVRDLVAREDKNELAAVIQFPLQVGPAEDNHSLDQREFLNSYDSVERIFRKGLSAYKGACSLYVDSQGVAIGDGEIWISEVRTNPSVFKITQLQLSKFSHTGLSIDEAKRADVFLEGVIFLASSENSTKFANLMHYPLHVQIGDKRLVVRNRQEFVRTAKCILPAKLLQALSRQDVSDGYGMTNGIMLLDGAIWIRAVESEFKIVSINVEDRYAACGNSKQSVQTR
jgi:hypothetical protein